MPAARSVCCRLTTCWGTWTPGDSKPNKTWHFSRRWIGQRWRSGSTRKRADIRKAVGALHFFLGFCRFAETPFVCRVMKGDNTMPQFVLMLRDNGAFPQDISPEEIQGILERYGAWSKKVQATGQKLFDG